MTWGDLSGSPRSRSCSPSWRESKLVAGGGPGGGAGPLSPLISSRCLRRSPSRATGGWHWTMGRFDPERIGPEGRREIASHSYPLVGPYDSADPDVLEYHTLLMKVAGIDGVVADWYGSEDFNDYAAIHRRTALLFEETK